MQRRTITEPFRGPDGEVAPRSIAESAFIRLGGVEQWVLIRGESIANPVLIFLHGGMSETTMWRYCNASLEKHFTCTYWDQRGAGKSADASISLASMTVERFLSDLDELVDWVCRRLGTTRVTIFGHSWGSVLGALYVDPAEHKLARVQQALIIVGAPRGFDSRRLHDTFRFTSDHFAPREAAGAGVSLCHASSRRRSRSDVKSTRLREPGPRLLPSESSDTKRLLRFFSTDVQNHVADLQDGRAHPPGSERADTRARSRRQWNPSHVSRADVRSRRARTG
jgi:pimeloyl-ACP methyl ester carboxylesterase